MPVVNSGRPAPRAASSSSSPNDSLTSTQKTLLMGLAVLVGPSLLKKFYEKPASEKVDLSGFNIVTSYDTPAIEKLDNTLRIEFCAS